MLESGGFVPLLFSSNSFGPRLVISITQWSVSWLQTACKQK